MLQGFSAASAEASGGSSEGVVNFLETLFSYSFQRNRRGSPCPCCTETGMAQAALKLGDFTNLAENYSRYRPGYSRSVRDALLALCAREPAALEVADVGAGTGIWSRLMAERV